MDTNLDNDIIFYIPSPSEPLNPFGADLATRRRIVVLAEPDNAARLVIAEQIRAAGHQVIEARDGFDLLAHLFREPNGKGPAVDLIVCRAALPGLTPLETMAVLRSFGGTIPVITLTTSRPGAVEEARRLGAAVVMSVPVDLDELRTTVDGLIDGASSLY